MTSPRLRLFLVVALAGLSMSIPGGYDQVLLSQPETTFKQWINETVNGSFTDMQLNTAWSWIVVARMYGLVASCLLVPFTDITGRRMVACTGSFLKILTSIACSMAFWLDNYAVLAVGRFINGLACGITWKTLVLFLTEISPSRYRGRIMVIQALCWQIGSIFSFLSSSMYLLGTSTRWPYMFMISALASAPMIIFLPFCPESARYLFLMKGDRDGAVRSVAFYEGPCDVEALFEEFKQSESTKEQSSFRKFIALLRSRHFYLPLILGLLFNLIQASGGRLVFSNYITSIYQNAGLSEEVSQLLAISVQVVAVGSIFIAALIVDKVNRRSILIACSIPIALLQLIVTVLSYLRADGSGWSASTIAIVSCVTLWFLILEIHLPSLYYVIIELLPQRLRATGLSIFHACGWILFAQATMFFSMLEETHRGLGMAFLLIPFVICSLLMIFVLPETRNRSLEELQRDIGNMRWGWGGRKRLRKEVPTEETPLLSGD